MESLVSITASRWKVDLATLGPPVPNCRLRPGTLSSGILVASCKQTRSPLYGGRKEGHIDRLKGHNSGFLQHFLSSWSERSKWWPPKNESLAGNPFEGFSLVLVAQAGSVRRLILWRHDRKMEKAYRQWTNEISPKIRELVTTDEFWTPQVCFLSPESKELWKHMNETKETKEETKILKRTEGRNTVAGPSVQHLLTKEFEHPFGDLKIMTTMIMATTNYWDFERVVHELKQKRFVPPSKPLGFFSALEARRSSEMSESWTVNRTLNKGEWDIIHSISL